MGDRLERILAVGEPLCVEPGTDVRLPDDIDPGATVEVSKKKKGKKLLRHAVEAISDLQRRLAAQERDAVLLVIQAMDAGGKDSTIRHVLSGVNPAGVHVRSFKEPSEEELEHPYLWRYEQEIPVAGQITVFNRSHYEEVLIVRVHPDLLEGRGIPARDGTDELWKKRFEEINAWEHELVDRGVRVVKVMLDISKEEQRVRFLRRCNLPEKHWKFAASDIREREHWDEYQHAYSEVLSHTSTEWAPWHVIPADHKWFARLATASILLGALHDIDPQFPEVGGEAEAELDAARKELEAQAPTDEPPDPVAENPDEYR